MLFKGVKYFIEETPGREERSPRERGSLTGRQMEAAPWRMWLKAGSQSVRRHGGSPRLRDAFHLPSCGFGLMGTKTCTAILQGAEVEAHVQSLLR